MRNLLKKYEHAKNLTSDLDSGRKYSNMHLYFLWSYVHVYMKPMDERGSKNLLINF